MKSKLRKVVMTLMSMVLVASLIMSNAVIVRADEEYDDFFYDDSFMYDESPDFSYTDDYYEDDYDDGDDWEPDEYCICADTYDVSFGQVYKDSLAMMYLPINIKNTGDTAVNLTWYKSDYEKVFYVDAPDSLYIGPGQVVTFHVSMNTNADPGSYWGELLVAADFDVDFIDGVAISLSGTILNAVPIVRSVTVSPSSVSMTPGSSQTFAATVMGDNISDMGVTWFISGNSDAKTTIDDETGRLVVGADESAGSFNVVAMSNADTSVRGKATVSISESKYTVTTRANPSNAGTTGGGGTVMRGSDLALLAAPNNGFTFVNWTLNGKEVSTSPRYEVKGIHSSDEYVANFRPTACFVKINKNNDKAGKVTESTSVNYGSGITMNASANSGYSFDGWYENDKLLTTASSLNVSNITSNREFMAKFSQNLFNIQVQANPSNVGVVTGGGNYSKGANVALSAKPIEGYKFISWTVNNSVISTDPNCTIQGVDRDFVAIANFEKINIQTFDIAATVATGSGSISPAGVTKVAKGSGIIYTFAPSSGYVIAAVAVDGVQKGAVTSYSFNNVNANHTIAVAFTQKNEKKQSSKKTSETPGPAPTPLPVVKNDENGNMTDVPVEKADVHQEEADALNEEMNVDPVSQPDSDYVDMDALTGVLQEANMTEEEARDHIANGNGTAFLEMASRQQVLNVTVHNEYANYVKETENTSFCNVVSIPNLQDVVEALFTEDEKINILSGNPAALNINIFNNDVTQTPEDKQIAKIAAKDNVNVGEYFEMVMLKTTDGFSQVVTKLDVPMTVVINIPDNLKAPGRAFCAIRAHNEEDGTLSISFLKDEDDDPNTMTFTTNKFSSYAIGYVGGDSGIQMGRNIVVTLIVVIVILMIVMTIIGFSHAARRKKRKRTHR